MTDISVILACRDRGRFLHPAVRAIQAATARAKTELHVSVEVIYALHKPSQHTEEYFSNYACDAGRVIRMHQGNLADCKNDAISQAAGNFIALLTSDTLVSSNWLCAGVNAASADSRLVVYHPATVVVYGSETKLVIVADQDEPDFAKETLFARNSWPDVAFGKKEIFSSHPFVESEQFNDSNWHWICDTVAGGTVHKSVAETLACIQHSDVHNEDQALVSPSAFFRTWEAEAR